MTTRGQPCTKCRTERKRRLDAVTDIVQDKAQIYFADARRLALAMLRWVDNDVRQM